MACAATNACCDEKQKSTKTRDKFNIGALPRGGTCPRQKHVSVQRAEEQNRRYWACSVLGGGAYGDVYLCWDALERKHVAIKQFIQHSASDLPSATFRELAILKRCNHEHIVPVINTLFDELTRHDFGNKYVGGFVMPHCQGGDANNWLTKQLKVYNESVPESSGDKWKKWLVNYSMPLARQLYLAINYLHERLIVHRDIKPQNCLIDGSNGRLYLSDMGLARQCTLPLARTYSGACCTLWYRPPELLLGSLAYGLEVDLWAAGCTVAEFCHKNAAPLVAGTDEVDQIWQIYALLGTPSDLTWPKRINMPAFDPKATPHFANADLHSNLAKKMPHLSNEALDFLTKTLQYTPILRMAAKIALKHPFLQDVVVPPKPPPAAAPSLTQKRKRVEESADALPNIAIKKKAKRAKKVAKMYPKPVRRRVVIAAAKL